MHGAVGRSQAVTRETLMLGLADGEDYKKTNGNDC